MTRNHRPRWPRAALTAVLALVLLVALAACEREGHPNTIFTANTDFNRDVNVLWKSLFFWASVVFVGVEAALLYVVFRYRRREGSPAPRHVHGNTTLEITWTAIPALILVFIAIPTVRTIWKTQAKAVPNALQVEVIGHQWWWEFRYPQYGITTANELYLPAGRTVNVTLRTADVIHSFWIPNLVGARDLVANHTNYLWFTPDSSLGENAWNGICKEYCGASHAQMRFRAFTVAPDRFEQWAAHQKQPAAFGATPTPTTAPGAAPAVGTTATATTATGAPAAAATSPATQGRTPATAPMGAPATAQATPPASPTLAMDGYAFPREKLPEHVLPHTPPATGTRGSVSFPANLAGDAARGQQVYSRSACIGCHTIQGNPASVGVIGPNLTHVGSRFTIAAAMYPNDARHLALWIKNAPVMKPGSLMPTLGKGQLDPHTGKPAVTGTLTDQEIADIVAYLQALK